MPPPTHPCGHARGAASLFALALLFVPQVSAAQCPSNSVSWVGRDANGYVLFEVSETSTDPAHRVSFNSSFAEYDLTTGTICAAAYVDSINSHSSRVVAVDRFFMQNAAAATLTVRLSIDMYLVTDPSGRMAWAGTSAQLAAAGHTASAESYGPNIDPFIEIQIDVVEGVPFEITYEAFAWGGGYYPVAKITCELSFVDVPEGAQIISCNGFGALALPVETTTWGEVKAMYR